MKFYSAKQKGFTLIELLVVISIIGMLSSVILVSLKTARDKARDTRVITDVRGIRTQLEIDKDSSGGYGAGISPVIAAGSCISFNGASISNYSALEQDIYSNSASTQRCIAASGLPLFSTYGVASYGLIIVQNATAAAGAWSGGIVPTAYAIYGRMNTGKYFCVDSTGAVSAAVGITPSQPVGTVTFQLTCAAN